MSTKRDVLELLRRANPVPSSERERLVERLEGLRATRTLDSHHTLASHAGSLLPRMHRKVAVRVAVAVLATIGAFLLVAPALGLRIPVVAFWKADRAPARLERHFESLSIGAPPGMDPRAIHEETRRVGTFRLSDGPHTLFVAPTRQGGFCLVWEGLGGGCARLGTEPLGVSWVRPRGTELTEGASLELGRTAGVVAGHVDSDYADAVEIQLADGAAVRPSIIWVSEPIAAGFFVYEVSERDRRAGGISSVVALDGTGSVIAEDRGRPGESAGAPPSDAILEKQRVVLRLAMRRGEAAVVVAPTRYEGRCAWLELLGRSLRFVPCLPKGYTFGPFAVRFVPTSDDVLLVGAVSHEVARIEVRFADGDVAAVRPQGGFVLFEIPSVHLHRGSEAIAVVGRGHRGEILHTATVDSLGGSRFPCLAALPLRAPRGGPFCP